MSAGTSETIRVGLAGLGRFGKLHASILSRMPQVVLAAVCDPLVEELDAARDTFGAQRLYTDYEQFVRDPDIDCFFIVTPEDLHEAMVSLALERRLPVFLEKPLATTWLAGRRIADAASEAGVLLQIGFVLRYETQHARLKEEIAAGTFGEIVSIRAKRNCSRAWFDVYGDRAHAVHETIVHDIDLVLWLLQAPCQSVYAVDRYLTGKTFPDACMALLRFGTGTMVSLETSWCVPDRSPANVLTESWYGTIDAELEVVGTRRSARLRILESGLEIWADDVTRHPEPGLWPVVHGQVAGALREEDLHFIEAVRTGTPSDVASLADAVEGLRIAEAIIESAASRAVVSLAS